MRVGLVCPYSLDVPGGVQNHVRDLAEALLALGHEVSVLAPSEEEAGLPSYVVPVGRAVAVPYNGSVARVSFGPLVAGKVHRWLRDNAFDVLHLHEPATPSISLLALWQAEGPVVATFHSSQVRSRALSASGSILRPWMEKINARIAVSQEARATLMQHVGGDPVVLPNGVYVDRYASVPPRPEWRGSAGTLAFVGRLDEPRKGFSLLVEAFEEMARVRSGVRLLVVGGGDLDRVRASLSARVAERVVLLGRAGDADKAAALRTADVCVAPNTGGESFGIVLVEAMAAGAAVLASDIPAFRRVLDDGRCGHLFATGRSDDLACGALALLDDLPRREALTRAASLEVRRYDWSSVAGRILEVYETVVGRPDRGGRR